MDDATKPTTETRAPNISTEHQEDGDARRPSDTLDRGQKDEPSDGPARKTSFIDNS
ncbi:MAG TPA: hypothetical protein VF638_10750 [Sphingomonas sp.]|jgi:hypothetical protein